MSDLPSAVGLDPVGEPGEGSEVPDRGLSRWSAVVGVEVGNGVVGVFVSVGVGGVGEGVGRGDEVDGFAESVGDFVPVDGCRSCEVDDGFDGDVAVSEELFGLVDGDRPGSFGPGDPVGPAGDGVLVEVDVDGRRGSGVDPTTPAAAGVAGVVRRPGGCWLDVAVGAWVVGAVVVGLVEAGVVGEPVGGRVGVGGGGGGVGEEVEGLVGVGEDGEGAGSAGVLAGGVAEEAEAV